MWVFYVYILCIEIGNMIGGLGVSFLIEVFLMVFYEVW